MSETSFDLHFAFLQKEISLEQYRARLKDLGWTEEEIDDALDGGDDDE